VRWPPAWELILRQSPASMDVNLEAEKTMALEAATRRQPEKIQQTKKNWCVLYCTAEYVN
jgi:hypothetical protein